MTTTQKACLPFGSHTVQLIVFLYKSVLTLSHLSIWELISHVFGVSFRKFYLFINRQYQLWQQTRLKVWWYIIISITITITISQQVWSSALELQRVSQANSQHRWLCNLQAQLHTGKAVAMIGAALSEKESFLLGTWSLVLFPSAWPHTCAFMGGTN